MGKLDVKAFGLTLGIIWAAGMLIVGILNMMFGWGTSFLIVMSSIYVGLKPTVLGVIIGTAWGFVDAGIAGVLIAWLYNKLVK